MVLAAVQPDPFKRLAGALFRFAAAVRASTDLPQGDEPASAASRIEDASAKVRALRRIVFDALIVILLLVLVAVVAKATFKRGTIIEPISVPWELSARGYTGQVVSQQLIDEIKTYIVQAQSSRTTGSLSMLPPDQSIPKIEVPGAGISLEAVIYYVREFVNVSDAKLSGEIVREPTEDGQPQMYRFRVRMSDGTHHYISSEPSENIDALLKNVALQFLERTSPYIAGLIHLKNRNYREAVHMAQLCIRGEADCNLQWGMNLLGRVDVAQGRLDDAERDFENAINRAPDFILPRYNLAPVAFRRQKFLQAFQGSLEAVLTDSNLHRRYVGFLNASQALSEMRKSKKVYRQSAELDSILERLVGSGACSAGETSYDELQVISIDGLATSNEQFEIFGLQDGKPPNLKSAIDFLNCAVLADPAQPVVFYRLGVLQLQNANFVEAQRAFEKSIALSSEVSQYDVIAYAHSDLGRSLAEQTQFADAFKEFSVASTLNPEYSWNYVFWAAALAKSLEGERNGDRAASIRGDAETRIAQAIALDSGNSDLKIAAAGVYADLREFDQAAGLYQEIIAEDKPDAAIVAQARQSLKDLDLKRQQPR